MASFSSEGDPCFESAGIVDNFRCSLCLNVLRKPVQCQRNEHHFCRSCITRHLKQTMNCPSCKEGLSLETLRPASQVLSKLLSQLKIRCDFHMRGCKTIMKVEELENHQKVCRFAPVVCSNKDCSEVLNRSNRTLHENQECQFRLVKCTVCGEGLVFRWYKMHSCVLRTDLEEVKTSVTKIEEVVTQMLAFVKPLDDYIFQGIKQNIIICGGQTGAGTYAEMYEWKSRKWIRQKTPKTFTLVNGTSFLYKGEMVVTGVTSEGCSGRSVGMETIAVGEDFAESQWKTGRASLPYNCYSHVTVLVQDRLLVFGGYQSSFLDGVHEVQLVSPYASKLLCRMPEARSHHGVGLFGDKVVIVGGQTKEGISNEVLMYDLARNKWKKMAPLEKPLMNMATVCWKDNIILLGGQNTTTQNPIHEVVMYNITSQESSKLPNMRQARNMCAAVITGNTIVVMGGCATPFTDHYGNVRERSNGCNDVEHFNFEFNSCWEELSPMSVVRSGATALAC